MTGSKLPDTTVIVEVLRNRIPIREVFGAGDTHRLSAVALAEVHLGFLETHSPRQEATMSGLMKLLEIVDVDEAIALRHARVKADLRRRGRPIPENDVWIAATAIELGLPLVAYDAHFAQVTGLRFELKLPPKKGNR